MRLLAWALLAVASCGAGAASAGPIAELQAAGRLEVSASLMPATNLVPGQKIRLSLKIATDRWFTGGTRISLPEVPGLVILQTDQFASNASENRQGQNWVVQRWALDVYAQRAGDFTIPPVKMQVKVNAGDAGDVEGQLLSNAISFNTQVPPTLQEAQHWVAAPAFTVSQSFDHSLQELQIGDAFEQEVVFEAEDLMAMMLPTFKSELLDGLAAYPEPPVLDNSNNRGQSLARRTQRISYVVQAEGQYLLPARDYFWWDTAQQELRLLSLPAAEIVVGSGVAPTGKPAVEINRRLVITIVAALAGMGLILWLALKWLPPLPLGQLFEACARLWQRLQALRRPALPRQLNPGSSAGE